MKILVIAAAADIRFTVKRLLELEFEGMEVVATENGLSDQRLLEEDVFDLVVTDLAMPGLDGLRLLRWIQTEGPAVPVLMISAHGNLAQAVEAMRIGAQDYLVKPFEPEELIVRIRRVQTYQQAQTRLETGLQKDAASYQLLGESAAMQEIMTLIRKVAPTPSTVLLTGESGTGKEVVANVLHQQSPRAAKPFVAVNLGGVPENLLESELFGYEKGAFTGASSRKIGNVRTGFRWNIVAG